MKRILSALGTVKNTALLLCASALLLAPSVLWAAASCTITSTDVGFGTYDVLDPSNTTSTGTLTVTCGGASVSGVSYTVALSTGSSGSYTPRTMSFGSNLLQYNLYTSATYTSIWGNAAAPGTMTVSGTNHGLAQILTVYGQIPAEQNVPAGSYTDSITATMTF